MTLTYLQVSASGDDGWVDPIHSGYHTYDKQFPVNSGLSWYRFRNCPIVPSSTINSAYLVFQTASGYHNTNHPSTSPPFIPLTQPGSGDFVMIWGDLPPNRIAPTGYAVATSRFPTSKVRWDFFTDWADFDFSFIAHGSGYPNRYESVDITTPLSEIISYPGYDTGNSIMFFIESGSYFPNGDNSFDLLWTSGVAADNGLGTAAAALIIEWDNNNGGRNLAWGFVPPSACDNYSTTTDISGYGPIGPVNFFTWQAEPGAGGNCRLPVTKNDRVTALVPPITVASTTDSFVSSKMLASGFNFNFPSNSIINGIEVRIHKGPAPAHVEGDFVIPSIIFDYEARLHHPTSGFIGVNKANTDLQWSNPNLFVTPSFYGGSRDTWGLVLGADDVKHPHFGFGFSVQGQNGALVDQIEMRVWHTPSYAVNSGITLFIDGVLTTNSGISLFIPGLIPLNSGITLFTQGPFPIDSGVPLNIGPPLGNSPSGLTLFTWGHLSETGSIPLFIPSVANAQPNLNLFVQSNTTFSGTESPPLFIFASPSGTNAFERSTTLFIKAGDFQEDFNLFIKGDDNIPFSQRMNLFTDGGGHPLDNVVPLYIGDSGIVGSSPLFIAGQSLFEGHNPFALPGGTIGTGLFNLFIQQKGIEESVSLFIGNQTNDLTAPLFITSVNVENSGLTLFAPSATVSGFNSQPLYSHGF